jgi:MTH538 TIR-like domain (DUF1863)
MIMKYNAFISYSQHVDKDRARALRSALHRLAKPLYRLRALAVFLDQASLSASPHLWTSIELELENSEYFILFASPEAAQSAWVRREIEWWLKHRSPARILIVVTQGELEWDSAAGDFDWAKSKALPDALRGRFLEEPLWIDLSLTLANFRRGGCAKCPRI